MITWRSYDVTPGSWTIVRLELLQVRPMTNGQWRWAVYHHARTLGEPPIAEGVAADEESAKACAIAASALMKQ